MSFDHECLLSPSEFEKLRAVVGKLMRDFVFIARGEVALIFLSILLFSVASLAQIESVFSTPGFTGQNDYTVENKVLELIRLAVPGSSIRAALYNINRVAFANELVLASHRCGW